MWPRGFRPMFKKCRANFMDVGQKTLQGPTKNEIGSHKGPIYKTSKSGTHLHAAKWKMATISFLALFSNSWVPRIIMSDLAFSCSPRAIFCSIWSYQSMSISNKNYECQQVVGMDFQNLESHFWTSMKESQKKKKFHSTLQASANGQRFWFETWNPMLNVKSTPSKFCAFLCCFWFLIFQIKNVKKIIFLYF